MIPVDQTILLPPSENCFAACVASILEHPLWTVPNFCIGDRSDWWRRLVDWIRDQDLWICGFSGRDDRPFDGAMLSGHGFAIASGPSPRGSWLHSVVVECDLWRIVHDPHPSRAGLAGFARDFILISSCPSSRSRIESRDSSGGLEERTQR